MFFVCFPVKAYCASIFLNMQLTCFVFFRRFWKNLPAPPIHYGVFDLFGPLTNFSKFCLWGCMRKSSNFDHIFGKTNRIRSSATTTPPLLYIVCITTTILGISQLHTSWQIFAHLCPQLNCFPQAFPHDTSVT